MAALVLVVVLIGPDGDPERALAALPAERRLVVRPPGAATRAPPLGVELVVEAEYDRAALAGRVRRDADELVVVLMEDERLSTELTAALVARCHEPARGRYVTARRVQFLGREIAADAIEVGWGDGSRTGAPVPLPGAVLSE